MAASVLSSGKTSRLYKKLVYEKQICTSASCFNGPSEIGGTFSVICNVKRERQWKKWKLPCVKSSPSSCRMVRQKRSCAGSKPPISQVS
ncbi:MAG: insulinase family protein [Bacteroidota bacterium]